MAWASHLASSPLSSWTEAGMTYEGWGDEL